MSDRNELAIAEAFRVQQEAEETIRHMEDSWAQVVYVLEELRALDDVRVNKILDRYRVSTQAESN